MPGPALQSAVQSYCFRGVEQNGMVAGSVRRCGLAAIELCGVHVDFNDEARHEPAIKAYLDAGVQIVGIGVQTFTGDWVRERRWFDFARLAGAAFISADFKPDTYLDALPGAQALSDEFGIKIAIHNHGGHHWLGSSQMLRHIFATTSEQIGLCLDTAWCLDAGEDPQQWVDEFGERLYGVHIKDFVFDHARAPQDVIVGTGNLDLPALLTRLGNANFSGWAVLEYEGDVNDPIPAVSQCVQNLRQAGNLVGGGPGRVRQ